MGCSIPVGSPEVAATALSLTRTLDPPRASEADPTWLADPGRRASHHLGLRSRSTIPLRRHISSELATVRAWITSSLVSWLLVQLLTPTIIT
ncbi:hypothetical protein FNV43_RR26702 [Rhamnella rubrinervis]|uniref:Uncharacterized protein n=1 Tax=Rhamnella rubrinervis TaxID=2594499 RepID=A0A8K0GP07_9ROSA|nr:hypothetical protein FNV43_RR26702 [Rhamnella rubrinervis]